MKLFDIIGGKIQLNPTSLIIPEFKILWNRDKTKDKLNVTNEISYIVFSADNSHDNPYRNYSGSDRESILKKDYPIKVDNAVKAALDKYKLLSTTRYERVVQAALCSLEDAEKYYLSVKSSMEEDRFDINEYLNSLDKLGKAFKSLRDLERLVEQDRADSSRVKGGNEIGDYEQ
jgi:hypothetical protein